MSAGLLVTSPESSTDNTAAAAHDTRADYMAYVFFTIITYLALLHKPLNVLTPSAPITLLPAEDSVDADDRLLEAIQANMVSHNLVDTDKCLIPYRRNRTLLGDYVLPSYLNTINMIFIVSPLYGAWNCLTWHFYSPLMLSFYSGLSAWFASQYPLLWWLLWSIWEIFAKGRECTMLERLHARQHLSSSVHAMFLQGWQWW